MKMKHSTALFFSCCECLRWLSKASTLIRKFKWNIEMIQMNNVFSTEGKGDVINEDNKRKNNAAGKRY